MIKQQRSERDMQRGSEKPKCRSFGNSLREKILLVGAAALLSGGCTCRMTDSQTAQSRSNEVRRLEQQVEMLKREVKTLKEEAGDCKDEKGRTSSLAGERLLESQVVISPDRGHKVLRVTVLAFDVAEGKSERDAMKEVVRSCRETGDMYGCVQQKAIAIPVSMQKLENPVLGFEYYDAIRGSFVSLDQMGLVSGNECDISNLAPGMIRVTFFPKADQKIMASHSSIRIVR